MAEALASYDDLYLARSPLDRCKLKEHLSLLYAAGPKLLVIDLDLSPASWLTTYPDDRQAGCEDHIYKLIEGHAATIPTVLMKPFEPPRPASDTPRTTAWSDLAKRAGVSIGEPDIPVTFGMTLRGDVGPDSLAGKAYAELFPGRIARPGHDSNTHILIDPRKYRSRDGVGVVPLPCLLCSGADVIRLRDHIVFFGAAYGSEGDTFVTPVGEVYGMEVHAASLLSAPGGPPRPTSCPSLVTSSSRASSA